jgi:hypothetical protein
MVGLRANSTDAIGEEWHFFHRSTNAKTFEAAQFWDLKVRIGDIAVVIQENFDFTVSLKTSDWVNRNPVCGCH